MAVSATYVAFLDFGAESQRVPGMNEPTHIGQLEGRVPMIELQDDGISLSTVDARMSREVLGDDRPVSRAIVGAAASGAT